MVHKLRATTRTLHPRSRVAGAMAVVSIVLLCLAAIRPGARSRPCTTGTQASCLRERLEAGSSSGADHWRVISSQSRSRPRTGSRSRWLWQINSCPAEPAPRRVGLLIGAVYRLRVTNIPRAEGMEVFPTIEVIDRTFAPVDQQGPLRDSRGDRPARPGAGHRRQVRHAGDLRGRPAQRVAQHATATANRGSKSRRAAIRWPRPTSRPAGGDPPHRRHACRTPGPDPNLLLRLARLGEIPAADGRWRPSLSGNRPPAGSAPRRPADENRSNCREVHMQPGGTRLTGREERVPSRLITPFAGSVRDVPPTSKQLAAMNRANQSTAIDPGLADSDYPAGRAGPLLLPRHRSQNRSLRARPGRCAAPATQPRPTPASRTAACRVASFPPPTPSRCRRRRSRHCRRRTPIPRCRWTRRASWDCRAWKAACRCPIRPPAPGFRRASSRLGRRTNTSATAAPIRRAWPSARTAQSIGLQMEDTVARFTSLDGRTHVEPSNKVDLYSPRFAAVRQVVDVEVDQQRHRADRRCRAGESRRAADQRAGRV